MLRILNCFSCFQGEALRDSLKFRITATATLAAVVWVAFLIAGSGLLHGAEAWRAPCDISRSGQSGLTITYPLEERFSRRKSYRRDSSGRHPTIMPRGKI